MSDTEEKTVAGLSRAEWIIRYVDYMVKHADILRWQAEEMADISFDQCDDETPEECADDELSCW